MMRHRLRWIFPLLTLAPALCTAWGQGIIVFGDAEMDKRDWLNNVNPAIVVGTNCTPIPKVSVQAQVAGVLWPTLLQIQDFLFGYSGPAPLCITGGSELGHGFSTGNTGHSDGFKIDLRIVNKSESYVDPLSGWITQHSITAGCRSNDNAPKNIAASGLTLALEFPVGTPEQACSTTFGSPANYQHWDILSMYHGLSVSPLDQTGITLQVGQNIPVSPVALTGNGSATPIPMSNMQSFMFDYNVPDDPNANVISVDYAGTITALSEGSATLIVSEGPYYQIITVAVTNQNPPSGGGLCSASDGCWQWNPTAGGSSGGWVWFPGSSNTGGPTPPGGPPPPGACSAPPTGPCWQWNPSYNQNGSRGAW